MSTRTDGSPPRAEAPARPGAPARSGGRLAARRRRGRIPLAPVAFLAPFLLLFLATFVAPIVYAVKESFFRLQRNGLGFGDPKKVFDGLGNYSTVAHDSEFVRSLIRVVVIGLVQVPVMIGLALLLALLLDNPAAPLPRLFRLTFFLPYAVPGVIGGLMWSFLYEPSVSPLVKALGAIGIHVDFTGQGALPWAIGNMITWAWVGYNMLIIHSALQAIPGELSDAAALDGCGALRMAWHIKIPMVRPALVMATVFSIIGTAQLYNEPVVMRAIAPSLSSTWTPIMAAQNQVASNNYSLAAAESVLLALLTFGLSFGFLRLAGRRGAVL